MPSFCTIENIKRKYYPTEENMYIDNMPETKDTLKNEKINKQERW